MSIIIPVAGISRYQDAAGSCAPGDAALLLPESDNDADKNALKVIVNGKMVGYVPRVIAATLAPRASRGELRGRVVERRGGSSGYLVGLRVKLLFDDPLSADDVQCLGDIAGFADRCEKLDACLSTLMLDREFFPLAPAEAYETTECLHAIEAALRSGDGEVIARAGDMVWLRYATRRGIHAWRMRFLASWCRDDAAELPRLAALLTASIADSSAVLTLNRLIAAVRLNQPADEKAALDREACRLVELGRGMNDPAARLRLGLALLSCDPRMQSALEAAGTILETIDRSPHFLRLLAEIVLRMNPEERGRLRETEVPESLARLVLSALRTLEERAEADRVATESFVVDSDLAHLRLLSSGNAWRSTAWDDPQKTYCALLALAGELGDGGADFLLALRLSPSAGRGAKAAVDKRLLRAFERHEPNVRALAILGSISKASAVGDSSSQACLATSFFVAARHAEQPALARMQELESGSCVIGDSAVSLLLRVAEDASDSPLCEICRDIALLSVSVDSVDHSAFADRCESAAAEFPTVGLFLSELLRSQRLGFGQSMIDRQPRLLRVLRAAVQRGHLPSAAALSSVFEEFPSLANDGEPVGLFELVAERGGAEEARELAARFMKGIGVPCDEARATKWLRRAAEAGDADSQCNYGFRLQFGIGTARDESAAVEWYHRAAKSGSLTARFNLGCVYHAGKGVPKSAAEGFNWFLSAARAGHRSAMDAVARRYAVGDGVERDLSMATDWASKLRAAGDARGALLLGEFQLAGLFGTVDKLGAISFLREAAAGGNVDAARSLALLHSTPGDDCEDAGEAFRWWRRGAELSSAEAHFRVAECYRDGKGVEQSRALWFSEAQTALDAGYAPAAVPLAVELLGEGATDSDGLANEVLLKGARLGSGTAAECLMEHLAWAEEMPVDETVQAWFVLMGCELGADAAFLDKAVTSMFKPIFAVNPLTHNGCYPAPDNYARKQRKTVDVTKVQTRAVAVLAELGRKSVVRTAELREAISLRMGDAMRRLIQCGEPESAWTLQTSFGPSVSRELWASRHGVDFSIAAFNLLRRRGVGELEKAIGWLEIASTGETGAIARYNLAVARVVADGALTERAIREISISASQGEGHAKWLMDRIEGTKRKSAEYFWHTFCIMLVAPVMVSHAIGIDILGMGEAAMVLWCCIPFLCGLLAIPLVDSLRVGSREPRRVDSATIATHVGIFRVPTPEAVEPFPLPRYDWTNPDAGIRARDERVTMLVQAVDGTFDFLATANLDT